jgi:hypothetical protein
MSYSISRFLWRLGPVGVAGITALGVASGVQLTDAAGCELIPMSTILGFWPAVWTSTPQAAASINSVVSSLLICLAALAPVFPRRAAEKALVVEFLCFVLYLFVRKGGYAVGFAGQADMIVLWYDALALEIRLLVLAGLFSQRLSGRPPLLRHAALVGATGVVPVILLLVKRSVFPFPLV